MRAAREGLPRATNDTGEPCVQYELPRTRPAQEPHGTRGLLLGCDAPALAEIARAPTDQPRRSPSGRLVDSVCLCTALERETTTRLAPEVLTEVEVIEAEAELKALQRHALEVVDPEVES